MYFGRINRKFTGIILAVCVLASSALGFGGGLLASELSPKPETATLAQKTSAIISTAANTASSGGSLSTPEIAALTANSVVEITTEVVATSNYMGQYITQGAGSGVIITKDGYIVTNNHVVSGANKINVRLKNGTTYSATLVGTDAKTDIAVVKIKATGLQPAVLGDSSKLKVGELAVAIGNPLGQLGGTVTDGIISALDREIDIGDVTMNLLQTNAAINPGNSGGGLFNGEGELIGIVNAKSSGSGIEGLGFAIPINDVKQVIQDLIKYGYVQGRIDLGITFVDISNTRTALMYGLQETGLYVKSVSNGSSAQYAGFQPGDLIVSFNGVKISSMADLNKAIDKCKVGQTVRVVVKSDYQTKTLSLKLAQYKSSNI
ncbi:MAG: trypsin-like peptidase domain-containing protein [Clostridiales bacterium]|nr:trypsin-like peptidase domain-containing protein [Clostridiales bacterium]